MGAALAEGDRRSVAAEQELELLHELRTLDELRALSDPLRVMLLRLLREREHTVKELCDLLGESSTRLYYHVGELERVGLVRLVRTEAKSGIVQKYYRSVARFVCAPFSLFQDDATSAEARAALDWWGILLEQAEMDLRQAFGAPETVDLDTILTTRNYIRLTPERAREFSAKLKSVWEELLDADDEAGTERYAFTAVFAPSSRPLANSAPHPKTTRARREPRVGSPRVKARPARERRPGRTD